MDKIVREYLHSDLEKLIKILNLENHIHKIGFCSIVPNDIFLIIYNGDIFYNIRKYGDDGFVIWQLDDAIEYLEIKYKKELRQIKIEKILAI